MFKNLLTIFLMALTLGFPAHQAKAASSVLLIEMDQQAQISVNGSQIRVTGAQGQILEIYNVAGVRILSQRIDSYDKTIDLNLNKGCYIVKVGKTARKISVK